MLNAVKNINQNKIIINNEKVLIETQENWSALDIRFKYKVSIESLLPNDYLIRKSPDSTIKSRVVIVKFNDRNENLSDLFKYKGDSRMLYCYLFVKGKKKIKLNIENYVGYLNWNSIGNGRSVTGEKINNTWWSSETLNFNRMISTTRNDEFEDYHYFVDYDRENKKPLLKKTTTQRTKHRKKTVHHRKDINIDILGTLNTSGGKLMFKETGENYTGLYHYNFKTKKIMTGEDSTSSSIELTPIKNKKKETTAMGKSKSKKRIKPKRALTGVKKTKGKSARRRKY